MYYWKVKAEAAFNFNKDVIPYKIITFVQAEDANEAIIKTLQEFPQYKLFIISVRLASKPEK